MTTIVIPRANIADHEIKIYDRDMAAMKDMAQVVRILIDGDGTVYCVKPEIPVIWIDESDYFMDEWRVCPEYMKNLSRGALLCTHVGYLSDCEGYGTKSDNYLFNTDTLKVVSDVFK